MSEEEYKKKYLKYKQKYLNLQKQIGGDLPDLSKYNCGYKKYSTETNQINYYDCQIKDPNNPNGKFEEGSYYNYSKKDDIFLAKIVKVYHDDPSGKYYEVKYQNEGEKLVQTVESKLNFIKPPIDSKSCNIITSPIEIEEKNKKDRIFYECK
tara:strand:+ start:211 stop:666 length:456 start_codon:yes stop_codon:yes gene_type:complete